MNTLLSNAASYLGPLSPGARVSILNYLDFPSPDRWLVIRGIVINPRSLRRATIWQNVMALDARYGWEEELPSALLVARAIRAATS